MCQTYWHISCWDSSLIRFDRDRETTTLFFIRQPEAEIGLIRTKFRSKKCPVSTESADIYVEANISLINRSKGFFFDMFFLSFSFVFDIIMSSAVAILSTLSDLKNNSKHDKYDPQTCKTIHNKLDQEAREQGLSYEERFQIVTTKTKRLFVIDFHLIFCSKARKNMSVVDKWATVFPEGISQCLREYWKERMSTAPLDPRFPNANQTK